MTHRRWKGWKGTTLGHSAKRRWRWLLVVLACVVGASTVKPGGPVVKAAVTRGSALGVRAAEFNPFGVNVDVGMINFSVEDLSGSRAHQLAREAGIGWVRYWLSWEAVEGQFDQYDWSRPDHDINAAIDQGLNVYVTIHSAPAWVHGGKLTYKWGYCGNSDGSHNPNRPGCQPSGAGAFAPFDPGTAQGQSLGQSYYWKRFVRTAVRRYGDRVKYWGFWNEPSSQWHWPEYDIAPCNRAVQVLDKVVKPAREAALEVNPSVVIVGPDEIDPSFLHTLLNLERNGSGGACARPPYGRLFDVIAIHAYVPNAVNNLDLFKWVLDQHDRREVWLTETDSNGSVSSFMNEWKRRGWIAKWFPHRLRTDPDKTCATAPGGQGFIDGNFQPCPSYLMMRDFTFANAPAMHFAGTTGVAGHDDFVLLQNPHDVATTATVRFSTDVGAEHAPSITIPANSRLTWHVGAGGWANRQQGVSVIPSVPWLPIWAEHADYWNGRQAGRSSQGSAEKSDTWYYAEGITSPPGGHWVEDITAYNPSTEDSVTITWRYLNQSGGEPTAQFVVAPRGHRRVRTWDVPGVESGHSAIVSAVWATGSHAGHTAPIVAERTVSWGGDIEGHSSRGVPYPALNWYFSEGNQGGDWSTYLLLLNPSTRTATVHVQYLLSSGFSQVYPYTIPARGRAVVSPPFAASFGIVAKSVGQSPAPIVAERVMYTGPGWTIGTASEGATSPSQRWIFTEASTEGPRFWTPYFLLANPTNVGANIRMRFRRADSMVVDHVLTLGAGQRVTIDPYFLTTLLQNVTFATEVIVESATTAGEPPPGIIAERAMYWDGTTGWYSGHASMGTP